MGCNGSDGKLLKPELVATRTLSDNIKNNLTTDKILVSYSRDKFSELQIYQENLFLTPIVGNKYLLLQIEVSEDSEIKREASRIIEIENKRILGVLVTEPSKDHIDLLASKKLAIIVFAR